MTTLKHILLGVMLLAGTVNATDQNRKVVHREEPEYPRTAARLGLHGTVKLRIWIKPDGSVRRLEYIGGHPLLAESALKAVRDWKYEPSSTESTAVVELKF
jgi:protein TonB